MKQSPKLFAKNPNIYSISKENIESLVNKDFQIPLKPEFGLKHKRRKATAKKHRRPFKQAEDDSGSAPAAADMTDAPRTITEVIVENNLARPAVEGQQNTATERVDVLPTPTKPERVLYKSKIKWIGSLKNNNDSTTESTKTTAEADEISDKYIAEERTIDIELQDENDFNIDYSNNIENETLTLKENPEKDSVNEEDMTENVRILYDPPSTPSLAHIPIYLELPVEECPKFCIQVKVEITRMGRGMGASCRSSTWCRRRRRRR